MTVLTTISSALAAHPILLLTGGVVVTIIEVGIYCVLTEDKVIKHFKKDEE